MTIHEFPQLKTPQFEWLLCYLLDCALDSLPVNLYSGGFAKFRAVS